MRFSNLIASAILLATAVHAIPDASVGSGLVARDPMPGKKPVAKSPAAAAKAAPAAKAPVVVAVVAKMPTTPQLAFPADNGDIKPWKYVGCYAGGVELTYNTNMCSCQNHGWKGTGMPPFTVEKCIATCKGAGFRYAGIKGENGKKSCWCGSGVSDADKLSSDSKCDVPCEDNQTSSTKGYKMNQCGGKTVWSIYKAPCFKEVDQETAAGGYQYAGCFYYQGCGCTVLPEKQASVSGDNLSVDSCLEACAMKGYAYAGMTATQQGTGKYAWWRGDQCWCGGRISSWWIKRHQNYPGDNSKCQTLCSATAKIKKSLSKDDYQFCGHGWHMSVYFNPDLAESDTCLPEPVKPEPEKPQPEKPQPEKPQPEKPEPEKPEPEKPEPENPDEAYYDEK
ncbi:hypothetical protein H072_6835 [Dactylellina haptotyla CBS 200.50]|uniref:WSC domain-containing protein n=1 Tax=Dactylellina haptotyla (strain CBS 200.50) TaxID=1284197 RepID=S8AE72_DACHA|nr:hypothetical protein H072_6835 [Dactylellina haptotyla CBS 200.50]